MQKCTCKCRGHGGIRSGGLSQEKVRAPSGHVIYASSAHLVDYRVHRASSTASRRKGTPVMSTQMLPMTSICITSDTQRFVLMWRCGVDAAGFCVTSGPVIHHTL